MKIAVLSRNPRLYSTRRLVEAGQQRGHAHVHGVDAQYHQPAEAEQHRGNAGSKACQRNNNDLIQESIPDLKMSEQLIPVAYGFPFA